jgi:pyruvate carboxylase
VREHARRIFKGELEQTLTEAVNRVLTDYVVRPYQQVCEDYADKSHMETQLFFDRVQNVIKTTDPHM